MQLIDKFTGLVTKKFNDFFYVDIVRQENNSERLRFLCKCRKSINFKNKFIFVGDQVIISQLNFKHKTATIEGLIKRNNLLERPSVANVSDIYVTFAVEEPTLNLSQLNKFLVNAESLNINVSLILTKCDLVSKKTKTLFKQTFQKWGYNPKTLNLKEDSTLNNLITELKTKKCSILMGPSGVGKTTLLNKIIPQLNNPTASVSRKIKRGKNTTRNVELFSLSEESYIVDTPGFNLNKIEFESKFIGNLFPEIRLQLNQKDCKCKFRDCLHLSEPGCGLDKNFERYIFYKELVEASMNHHYQNLAD